MTLFPLAIAFGHAPGVSMTQTIGASNVLSAGATLTVTRLRPSARPNGWTIPLVILLGFGISSGVFGIPSQSSEWIAVRNTLVVYFGVLGVTVLSCRIR